MGKDTQGELTKDPYDKNPYRRKEKSTLAGTRGSKPRSSERLFRIKAVAAKKHVTLFATQGKPHCGSPRSRPANQVTKDGYTYVRSTARRDSPLYGKWYKRRKGETSGDYIDIVDSPLRKRGRKIDVKLDSANGSLDEYLE